MRKDIKALMVKKLMHTFLERDIIFKSTLLFLFVEVKLRIVQVLGTILLEERLIQQVLKGDFKEGPNMEEKNQKNVQQQQNKRPRRQKKNHLPLLFAHREEEEVKKKSRRRAQTHAVYTRCILSLFLLPGGRQNGKRRKKST